MNRAGPTVKTMRSADTILTAPARPPAKSSSPAIGDAFLSAQGVAVASARAGNVIGGGDWSDDRVIPDAVRAWQAGRPLQVRRPQAVRPWQYVLDPLAGYMTLARKLWEQPALAGSYNFGPETGEVGDRARTGRNGARRLRHGRGALR